MALASRPVKVVEPIILTPILFNLFTRPTFVMVISVIVSRRVIITWKARKAIVETAIDAVRVVVLVSTAMIANRAVLVHARIVVIGWARNPT